jgi:hypothetical protein
MKDDLLSVAERETVPEEMGDDKPPGFYEGEESRRRFEAGLEASLREKGFHRLSESIGDAIDHSRQDENHRV